MSKSDPISDDEHDPQQDEGDSHNRIFLWIAAVLVLAIYAAVSVYNWKPQIWLDY